MPEDQKENLTPERDLKENAAAQSQDMTADKQDSQDFPDHLIPESEVQSAPESETDNDTEASNQAAESEPERDRQDCDEIAADASDDIDAAAEVTKGPAERPEKKIFIVLSQRDEMNQDCIAAILKMGVGYVVLNDPSSSESITERLNTHPHIQFALVLLSGDDFIYDRLTGKPATAQLGPKPNVVFHLGYTLAHFGHVGTLAIYREQRSFHLPTGQHHTIFVPYRKGGPWEEILESKLKHINVL